MILLRTQKLLDWLNIIERNQTWLAKKLRPHQPFTRSYISQLLSNRCQISNAIIDKLLSLTQMEFNTLFYSDGEEDTREFYGKEIFWKDKMWTYEEYKQEIDRILSAPFKGNNIPKITKQKI